MPILRQRGSDITPNDHRDEAEGEGPQGDGAQRGSVEGVGALRKRPEQLQGPQRNEKDGEDRTQPEPRHLVRHSLTLPRNRQPATGLHLGVRSARAANSQAPGVNYERCAAIGNGTLVRSTAVQLKNAWKANCHALSSPLPQRVS